MQAGTACPENEQDTPHLGGGRVSQWLSIGRHDLAPRRSGWPNHHPLSVYCMSARTSMPTDLPAAYQQSWTGNRLGHCGPRQCLWVRGRPGTDRSDHQTGGEHEPRVCMVSTTTTASSAK